VALTTNTKHARIKLNDTENNMEEQLYTRQNGVNGRRLNEVFGNVVLTIFLTVFFGICSLFSYMSFYDNSHAKAGRLDFFDYFGAVMWTTPLVIGALFFGYKLYRRSIK
jgi:hypothetical protein